ncbi:dihydrofolate reductase [Salinibacillus kushneri]|uniref:Dihydrofolate reductase n=1 Tax=Salinibacillus kushneri TaxID=237682 RepID=A0A1I0DI23_9BACI|nr:dihydrofolate reductase [Salinibacillus kushneri]SET32070.1 dihydrofolate reductase [Salinibacillus kushneri]
MISLLVAMDQKGVIGKDGDLPWRLPNDLKFFKETTMDHTIVMGRKTYQSIGRPLPRRNNVVLTRDSSFEAQGCFIIHSWDTVKEWNEHTPEEEVFVIGGSELFKDAIYFADKMYITEIDESFEGDTYFPSFDSSEWELVHKEKGIKNVKNPYDYYFCTYIRKTS